MGRGTNLAANWSHAAQDEHLRLKVAAEQHYEATGDDPDGGWHAADCYCCCWDVPCFNRREALTPLRGLGVTGG